MEFSQTSGRTPNFAQKMQDIPVWEDYYRGRIIIDQNSNSYIGGLTSWLPLGLDISTIKRYNIAWDNNLTYSDELVNASDVPILYNDTTSNVQLSIDDISVQLEGIRTGQLLQDNIITASHISFDSDDILLGNTKYYFSSDSTVDDAINLLYERSSEHIPIGDSFGNMINSDATTVYEALLDLEEYCATIDASTISGIIPGESTVSTIQVILNYLYEKLQDLSLTDINGFPGTFGQNGQLVYTDGESLQFGELTADIVLGLYGAEMIPIQQIFYQLSARIDSLSQIYSNMDLDASDISYDFGDFSNVDDILDYLLHHAYTPTNKPTAINVLCDQLGIYTNVQEVLEYHQSQINNIIGQLPATISSENVWYNSPNGFDNVKDTLDNIYLKLSQCSLIGHHHDIYYEKSDIDDMFTNLGPLPAHNHDDLYYRKYQIDQFIDQHTHDLLYYRKDEVDQRIADRSMSCMIRDTEDHKVMALTDTLIDHTFELTEDLPVIIQFGFIVKSAEQRVQSLTVELYEWVTVHTDELIYSRVLQTTDLGFQLGTPITYCIKTTLGVGSHHLSFRTSGSNEYVIVLSDSFIQIDYTSA